MNIIAIQLVLVGIKPGLSVMHKILKVVVAFLFMHVHNSTLLGRDSLLLILMKTGALNKSGNMHNTY